MRQVIRMQVAVVVAVVIVRTAVRSDGSSVVAATDVRIVVRVATDVVLRVVMIAVMVDDMVLVVLVTEVVATVVVVRVMMAIIGDRSGTRRLDLQHDLSDVVYVLVRISGRRSFQIGQWIQTFELFLDDARKGHVFQVPQLVAASSTGNDRLIKRWTTAAAIAAMLLVLLRLAFDVSHEDGTGGR